MARIISGSYTATLGPAWAGDYFNREHLVPGGAKLTASAFASATGTFVVVGAAGAAAGATTVPVDALTNAIPSGTTLDFGGAKFARLTAAAASGATSLTVAALPTALVDNDTALYEPEGDLKTIVSGTLLGRTYAERAAGTAFGPAADADDEIYILAHDVTDADTNNDCELYRHGSIVKENFLPNWANLSSALQAAVRANYQTTRGAN